ncbi:hypothetical protein N7E81_11025 [Reichenbachiella carrageenanivorans]|uniref:DUF559 domain-containing protein n=1 Tax=Reichenbachiella carrageenanivorans TaxID=2979869 RepID=A0ABY6D233_9BACT|nr:hypothetical protein [Reichenbachiella carrageenanivorans]UXX77900.1 hypothetical protein N7E81_11025 [Reichenbachiella carrageenanivorans]
MITEEYIKAYKNFFIEELGYIKDNFSEQEHNNYKYLYDEMFNHISSNPREYIIFKSSNVKHYEMEFSESVSYIRNKLKEHSRIHSIPLEVIWLPRVKINDTKWDQIININVANLIREIFDKEDHPDFNTYRLYQAVERKSDVVKWLKSKNAKNFLYEFQVSVGIKKEALIRKLLYLFDKDFVRSQKLWMSSKIWLHNEIIEAYGKWSVNNNLWGKIDYVKRQIFSKEILDESRPEIKFLRLLDSKGYKNRYIHDEQISWNLKFRPDFWFINESLIVEYDEYAHKFQIEEDRKREKIIKRYLPNISFIRIQQGNETKGLEDIADYLDSFDSKKNEA